MDENESFPPEVTLVGLGPPGARAEDADEPAQPAPETIRPWALPGSGEDDVAGNIPLSPLLPGLPPKLVPSRGAVHVFAVVAAIVGAGVIGVSLGRGPLAPPRGAPGAAIRADDGAPAARAKAEDAAPRAEALVAPQPARVPSPVASACPSSSHTESEEASARSPRSPRLAAPAPALPEVPPADPVRVRTIADAVQLADEPEGDVVPGVDPAPVTSAAPGSPAAPSP